MKFHEVAAHVLAHGCAMVFPSKVAGEFAVKDSSYCADKVEGLEDQERLHGDTNRPAPKAKGFMLDAFSASAFAKVREALNETNRAKFDEMAARNPTGAVGVAFKLIK